MSDERQRRRRGAASRRPSAARPTSCSTPARTASSTRCATRRPTSWPRRSWTSSRARSSGIGPAIDDGFYYDFELAAAADAGRPRGDRGADGGERRRRPPVRPPRAAAGRGPRVLRRARPAVQGRDPRRPRARRPSATATPMPPTSVYEHGPFVDLCKGPHVASTGKIGPFKLLAVAGAYWRGDEKRPMLQRIYGTVWATQEELDQYLWRRDEAKKRDHRRLGVQLDLFSFHDVSPGAAVLAPQGLDALPDARGRDARAPGAARLPGDLHADRSSTSSSGSSPATGTSTASTCSSSRPRSRPSASSR